jgi:phosphorylcholine metabolism protein LicD
MNEDSIFLKETVNILKSNNINFWLCHGTLLGIIRENRLLPWDHDIDFAIWSDEHSREDILKLFANYDNFHQIIIPSEMDNVNFFAGNKRIDINFYNRNKEIAYIKWVAPGSIFDRLYYFIIYFIYKDIGFKTAIESSNIFAKFIKIIFLLFLLPFKYLLNKSIKNKLYKSLQKKINYTGYSYPMDLMKFKDINFLDIEIPVPINYNKCLEITYGKDWKTPKQDYIWHKEAKNLLQQH